MLMLSRVMLAAMVALLSWGPAGGARASVLRVQSDDTKLLFCGPTGCPDDSVFPLFAGHIREPLFSFDVPVSDAQSAKNIVIVSTDPKGFPFTLIAHNEGPQHPVAGLPPLRSIELYYNPGIGHTALRFNFGGPNILEPLFAFTLLGGVFDFDEGLEDLLSVGVHQVVAFDTFGTQAGEGSIITTLLPGVSSGVPEPATWALMLSGFGFLGFLAWRRRVGASARLTPA